MRKSNKIGFGRAGSPAGAAALGLIVMGSGMGALALDALPAQASTGAQSYEIPAGPVAAALNRLADKSGAVMVYDSALTKNKKTQGVAGVQTLDSALGKILSGTGLAYRLSPDGKTVAIMLAQADTGVRSDAGGAIPLPTVEVEAPQGGTGCGEYGGAPCSGFGGAGLAQDPFNPSYVLPYASTGTKTDTPVMDTPLNVQSVTQQVLTDQQDITLGQALQNVSGVTVPSGIVNGGDSRTSGIFVRGFVVSSFYRDGYRVDGLVVNDITGATQLANIASVEVLKGPAAVLYGLVEPGGIVNLVTKEPLNAPYFSVQQQIGSLALYRTTVDATGPLTDDKSVLYRMNMSYENNGAPYGSLIDLTHGQNIFLAPVVKWNIDGATWVKLEAQYSDDRTSAYFPIDPLFNGALVPVPRSRNYAEGSSESLTQLFSALTWSHNFNSDWSIKQQIAYNLVNSYALIRDAGPIPIIAGPNGPAVVTGTDQFNTPAVTYSTNVDITGHIDTFGAKHTLLLGGDVYRDINHIFGFENIPGGWSQVDLFNPIHPGIPAAPVLPFSSSATSNTQDTAGLYLQDQVKLPYDFFLLAGARYQYIRQTSASAFELGANPGPLKPDGNPLVGQALTPRYGLLWRPQEWVSLYGNYTEGFGSNSVEFTQLVFPGVLAPPSSAQSWEAGFKLEFFNGKLRATADYYDLTKTNVPITDPNPAHSCNGGGPGSCVVLVGEARSKGPELDVQGEILPGWSVIAAYTNQDVRVIKGAPAASGGTTIVVSSLSPGERFPSVPQNLASLWTTYEFQDDALKGLKIGGGYTYHGSQPYTFGFLPHNNFPLLPSWGTVNLMAAYSFNLAGAKMTAQVNVTNLFDRTYYTDAALFSAPGPGLTTTGVRQYGAPFAVVGSLRAQFPASAQAVANPPPPSPVPVFTWTGFYLGGQIGYAWGDNDGTVAFATPGGLFGSDALVGNDAQGVIGGGHLGYNLQIDQWVVGAEGTVDGTTLSRNVLVPVIDPTGATPGGTVTGTVRSGLQGSIRGRAGVAFDRLLIYGTGGVAFAGFDTDLQISGTDAVGPFFASGSRSSTRTGWTAGGGVEYAITPNWSVFGEYRYSDFGHITDLTFPGVVGTIETADRHLAQNQVEVGFSYKFDSSGPETGAGPAPFDFSQIQISQIDTPKVATAPVRAADRPPPAFTSGWTGFYAGAQIGYVWGGNNGNVSYATPNGLSGGLPLDQDAQGVIGGVHIGYNYQFDQFVIGIEGTIDPTTLYRNVVLSAPDTVADPTGALGIGNTVNSSIQSTIQGGMRARAGIAVDRLLFYGTGGVAFGAFKSYSQMYGIDLNLAPFFANDIRSTSRTGWTAGGGIEYAINNNWSVFGEYRYSDFGHITDVPTVATGLTYAAERNLAQNQVQAGFSYKFASPPPVVSKY